MNKKSYIVGLGLLAVALAGSASWAARPADRGQPSHAGAPASPPGLEVAAAVHQQIADRESPANPPGLAVAASVHEQIADGGPPDGPPGLEIAAVDSDLPADGGPPTKCRLGGHVQWLADTAQYYSDLDDTYSDSGLLSIDPDPNKKTVAIIGASVDLMLANALREATDRYNIVVAYCSDRDEWQAAADWLLGASGPVDYAFIGMHVDIFDGSVPVLSSDPFEDGDESIQATAVQLSEHLRENHFISRDDQLISIYPEWEFNAPGPVPERMRWPGPALSQEELEARSLEYGNYFRHEWRTAPIWTPYNPIGGEDLTHPDTDTVARAVDRVIYHLDNMRKPMPWGSYWNFGAYDFTPWNSNGDDLMTVPRFAQHICNDPGVNDTPGTCRIDTRATVRWQGVWYELITANGKFWNFNVDAGYDLVANGDLSRIDRYTNDQGPCYGQPEPCTFDSVGMIVTDKPYEIITANGKYYNYAPLEDDDPVASGWMYEIPRWASLDAPCYQRGEECRFDAYDIYADASGEVYEVIIAYDKWYKINVATGALVEDGNLLDVPHFKSGPCVGQTDSCSFDTIDLAFDQFQSITVSP